MKNNTTETVHVSKDKRTRGKKWATVILLAAFMAFCFPMPVMAEETAITGPLNTLLTIVTDLVTGIGAIITLYGIFEFGNAQQSQDGAMKSFAIQRISGGLIMVVAPQLLQLFIS